VLPFFFGGILNSLGARKQQVAEEDLDEEAAVSHHKKFFGSDDEPAEATSGGMGSAAAVQALKMFSGGGGGSSGSQSEFIGLAMSQASKLFDDQESKGKVSSGSSKEGAVAQAAQMALKMYLKSQGGGSGGMGSLMGLAGKFL